MSGFRTGARQTALVSAAQKSADPMLERTTQLDSEIQTLISDEVMTRMNVEAAGQMQVDELVSKLVELITIIVEEKRLQVNGAEQRALALTIADDMTGIGPIEQLMKDEGITDIMINGPYKIFIEQKGRVFLTPIKFRNEKHVREIAGRMARNVGRRLDDMSPLVDARLADGSRVNIVIPPVALDGTTISIRRFSKQEITLDKLVQFGAMNSKMRDFLMLAAEARLNLVISGGTSSGKTTLLNAISRGISNNERILTIEDAAELRLQQTHVVRLETRPKSGGDSLGENIDQSRLVANALRMRPDRIILGEVRRGEAFDLLQAMNTGHDGSMGTCHANSPRDALARFENMVMMAGFELPVKAIRTQIASALEIIVQAERMVDGKRRVSRISEVTGIEGDTISLQDLFHFEVRDMKNGVIDGDFVCSNANLRCRDKLRRVGLENEARRIFST